MVSKLELNNELITLRKHFAKAKTHTISKLTRKLKEIQHGKTKDPANTKLDGKESKLVEEIKLLKDATKLDTVKKVFAFDQDPEKVIKLQKATAEQRAVSRLLMNQFLKDAVGVAKKKLDLKEDDEEWKKLLFEMGKNKKKKLKKEKFEAKNGEKNPASEDKVTDEKSPKKAAKKDAKKKDKVTSLSDKSKAIDKTQKHKQKAQQKRKQFMKSKSADGAEKPAKPAGDAAEKPKAAPKKESAPVGPPKKVTLFPMESRDNNNQTSQRKPPRDFGDKGPKKWNNDRPNNKPGRDFGGSGSGGPRKWNNDRPGRDFGGPKKWNNDRFQNKPGGKFGDSKPKWNNDRGDKSFPPRQQSDNKFQRPKFEKNEKLHPSWEAKKAKKPAISEFKGKKMTFDD